MEIKKVLLFFVFVLAIWIGGMTFFGRIDNTPTSSTFVIPDSLTVTRTFKDGVHTISGTITTPTPCYRIDQNVRIAESYPEQIFIDLSVAPNVAYCAAVVTETPFSIDALASENARISISINGQHVDLLETKNNTPDGTDVATTTEETISTSTTEVLDLGEPQ